MSDPKDYAPLSAACVRALHDKLYEKRKTAALEIEKMVKEFAANGNTGQIKRILKVLGEDFATSQNSHARKGGLIGLAATAVALGKDSSNYTEELILPIVANFNDSDLRVRYYACESLYNVVKVTRGAVLPYFAHIFKVLSKVAADPEQSVKNASELLDRLMKDIVTETPSFDLVGFISLLRERMYTKSSFARQFIIGWVSVLHSAPDFNLIVFLPDILDGLFKILEDPMLEVKKMCDTVLGEFLLKIKDNPSKVDFVSMINILIIHAQSSDDLLQFTSITWIKEFVQLSGPLMLPYMSGIFTAMLPCLAYDTDARRNIKETATAVNYTLMKLIALQVDEEDVLTSLRPSTDSGAEADENESLHVLKKNELDLQSVVGVLTHHLAHNSVQTKVAVLRWIHHLFTKIPNKMFGHIDELFPSLLRTLSDPADEVVQQCLVVLAEIISSPAGNINISPLDTELYANRHRDDMSFYYPKFLVNLLNLFNKEKHLLENRGSFIIRQLCILLNPEDIYRTLAKILLDEPNLQFASLMVENLSMILLTSSELFELRTQLKDLATEESVSLFCCLYKTWCHNPVATVALCFLTQSYGHVCSLIYVFGNFEVSVEFLTEIDKLVQLIESPIFAYLRLELLEVPCNQQLVKALYGLLMLLPQTDAFQTLRTRLACIPGLHLHYEGNPTKSKYIPKHIDFSQMLDHFITVQENHQTNKQQARIKHFHTLEKEFEHLNT